MLIIRKTSLVVLYNAERRCWHACTVPKNTRQIFLPKIFQSGKFQMPKKNLQSPCHLTQE